MKITSCTLKTLLNYSTAQRAEEYGWKFEATSSRNTDYFKTFYSFKSRPIEFKSNCFSYDSELEDS